MGSFLSRHKKRGSCTPSSSPYPLICVLGEGGVGKTSYIIRLCSDCFAAGYDPNIIDSYRKQLVVEGEPKIIEILDTSVQEEFIKTERKEFIQESDAFLVLFSITNRNSFNQVDEFLEEIKRVKEGDACPVLVIGNKCDLEDKRQVSTSEAESKFNHIFLETSAKTRTNIEEAMERIVSMFISGENSFFNYNIKGAQRFV